jgi:hypothetical protein
MFNRNRKKINFNRKISQDRNTLMITINKELMILTKENKMTNSNKDNKKIDPNRKIIFQSIEKRKHLNRDSTTTYICNSITKMSPNQNSKNSQFSQNYQILLSKNSKKMPTESYNKKMQSNTNNLNHLMIDLNNNLNIMKKKSNQERTPIKNYKVIINIVMNNEKISLKWTKSDFNKKKIFSKIPIRINIHRIQVKNELILSKMMRRIKEIIN